jgi:hypothetical protein
MKKVFQGLKQGVQNYWTFLLHVPKLKTKILLSALNAGVLVILSIAFQYISYVRADETLFYKWFAILRHNVLKMDRKPLKDSVVFLDVSKDLQIVSDTFPNYGFVTITNRKVLNAFFNEINKNNTRYKYIICDLSFDYPSEYDSLLKSSIEKTTGLIVAASSSPSGLKAPLFDVETSSVEYGVNNRSFVKMPLYDAFAMTLPTKLITRTAGKRYSRRYGLTFEDGWLAFNTIIPNFYYRPRDLVRGSVDAKPNLHYLGEIIKDSTYFEHFLKDKLIILGDFSTDIHATYLGPTPGPLILLNTYLTMKEKSAKVSIQWVVVIFFVYFILSYLIFVHPNVKLHEMKEKVKYKFIKKVVGKYVSYMGIMIVVGFFSFTTFGIFVSLFYVASYLTILELLLEKRRSYRSSKNIVQFINRDVL